MQKTTPYFYHSHPVNENDVICGKKCEKHPGNAAFRNIVIEFSNKYQTTSTRDTKKQIIEAVIQRVQDRGGRFIKESDDQTTMEVVSPQYIYEKVSHALRSARISNSAKTMQAAAEPNHQQSGVFEDLLATQQRLFYSYLMASGSNTDDDNTVSSSDATAKASSQPLPVGEQRPSLCNVVDQSTIDVLLDLHEV